MKRAFTLIELLIVIAIIAILALIAVPNFLEAQTRAKVSRVHADMRSIALAIETYAVDWGRAPIGSNEGSGALNLWDTDDRDFAYNQLTTPTAYIVSIPDDPFTDRTEIKRFDTGLIRNFRKYQYQYWQYPNHPSSYDSWLEQGYTWYLRSPGPSRMVGPPFMNVMIRDHVTDNIYDSSNGTMSIGQIYRTNKGVFTGANM
jgi:prepilin-type N-terminal cleavage/methylation domain-containing protein